ncbi:MAG: hypothetical protein J6A07_07710 [Firmicutes bacterium]|nr:hypothetical protein [Bacillota bacterium]
MTYTTIAKREDLSKLLLSDDMTGSFFKVTISPISEAEIDEIEFKSLKGIAGEPLDIDEVKKERLGL